MEELQVKPDEDTVRRVANAFRKLGQEEKSKLVTKRYGLKWKYIHFIGERVNVRTEAWEEEDLHLTETETRDLTLIEIENLLKGYNKSLRDTPSMPFSNMDMCYQQLMSNGVNRLICDELRYDRRQLVVEHADLLQKLTDEQKRVYKQILAAVNSGDGGVFFLYGYGSTGKTFVWKTLAAAIRSKGQINSPLAELIIRCKLIIWDEAPMVNRLCIEALDRTMRDILRFKNANSLQQPFGGKTVVFGGDFRQILPVIPKGSRQDIFDDWILSIGDGRCGDPIDGIDKIGIPDDILIDQWDDPIVSICKATYPELFLGVNCVSHLKERAILAPTLHMVDEINSFMMSLNSEESKTYYSSDTACQSEAHNDLLASVHTPEFLNSIRCSGVPNHELTLKVGTPIMLLRNIDHSAGLCNGTRLVVSKLGRHIIEARSFLGSGNGDKVFIPRMTLTPSDHRIPFKFQRRQFPIMVSYAMSINKSQGQSLSNVGLILKKHVFTHGQLYVALSRVTHRRGLKILICHDEHEKRKTDNVVYKEVFRNLS
ncbi:ATP-dependent DNA helicase PIF1-like [Arachis ipaensis]|uniref:ATP-dependent DNA helicase PIF1-like n=1 Tax=Arachis ipaensis TaxID=130454 RepID=UPI000A2B6925|nr:ATP-dependent DNA helicase PIF1-like [Arachis ipaensis]